MERRKEKKKHKIIFVNRKILYISQQAMWMFNQLHGKSNKLQFIWNWKHKILMLNDSLFFLVSFVLNFFYSQHECSRYPDYIWRWWLFSSVCFSHSSIFFNNVHNFTENWMPSTSSPNKAKCVWQIFVQESYYARSKRIGGMMTTIRRQECVRCALDKYKYKIAHGLWIKFHANKKYTQERQVVGSFIFIFRLVKRTRLMAIFFLYFCCIRCTIIVFMWNCVFKIHII